MLGIVIHNVERVSPCVSVFQSVLSFFEVGFHRQRMPLFVSMPHPMSMPQLVW